MTKNHTHKKREQNLHKAEQTEPDRPGNSSFEADSDELLQLIFKGHGTVILLIDSDSGTILDANSGAETFYGYSIDTLKQMKIQDINAQSPEELAEKGAPTAIEKSNCLISTHRLSSGEIRNVEVHSSAAILKNRKILCLIIHDITEHKGLAEATTGLGDMALTRSLDSEESITFEELFNIQAIQQLQDQFANATGVASIITQIDGKPITRPSNFRRLCIDIIRKTDKGLANCYKSDAKLGKPNTEGPTIQHCLSGGLWDSGAGISVGGKHIANWLIGQIRDETQKDETIRAYAREIGADEEVATEAFHEVPAMSSEQFEKISQVLFTIANQLSTMAYHNLQQARFIREIQQTKSALKESEQRFKALHNASFGGIAIHDKGVILECNKGLSEITGYEYDRLIGMDGLNLISEDTRNLVVNHINTGYEKPYLAKGVRKNGEIYNLRLEARNIPYKRKKVRVVEFRDITDRIKTQQEKESLESQLRQAQKLEAVGRLAGGVAHDFNNMLSLIIGHAELALEDAGSNSSLRDNLAEIRSAGERSADLTRQLLAFARKQTVDPKVLDLNKTVAGMIKMLQRLIGEDLDLAWIPGPYVWPVKIDPSQLDQILANLCVNARDAIKGIGKITIETGNESFDQNYCANHSGFIPGDYILLAVSDNGCGMDNETLDNVFDPFFTTKESGKGTGLGLSTLYGIIKQNNGFISVYSELSQGSVFRIYLPRYQGDTCSSAKKGKDPAVEQGSETILLVEDAPAILEMTRMMLEKLGYSVITAKTPAEAINLARKHAGEIQLLLTDVIMPQMNGRDLAQNLVSSFPKLKRLFMSGYTANVIAHHGVLDEGVNFIQKPFSKKDLGAKVRKVLDQE